MVKRYRKQLPLNSDHLEIQEKIKPVQVSMKTQGVINPLGEIIAHDVTFEPNVNVYDRRLQDGIERVIRVECPGVQQEDIDWEARHS